MKIEIKARSTGAVLFTHDADTNTLRLTLEAAVYARAYLSGAYLSGADLSGADLSGAYLSGADLSGADLSGANLSGADLSGADLSRADLSGAYLARAYLSGANLSGAYLSGADLSRADLSGANLSGAYLSDERPVLQIGPIGSRGAYLVAYFTSKGVMIRAGCWFGTRTEFASRVTAEHGDNVHAREYRAALAMIDAHAELWTPAVTEGVL